MERKQYVTPAVELLDIAVERGFEGSVTGQAEDFDREVWNE